MIEQAILESFATKLVERIQAGQSNRPLGLDGQAALLYDKLRRWHTEGKNPAELHALVLDALELGMTLTTLTSHKVKSAPPKVGPYAHEQQEPLETVETESLPSISRGTPQIGNVEGDDGA